MIEFLASCLNGLAALKNTLIISRKASLFNPAIFFATVLCITALILDNRLKYHRCSVSVEVGADDHDVGEGLIGSRIRLLKSNLHHSEH